MFWAAGNPESWAKEGVADVPDDTTQAARVQEALRDALTVFADTGWARTYADLWDARGSSPETDEDAAPKVRPSPTLRGVAGDEPGSGAAALAALREIREQAAEHLNAAVGSVWLLDVCDAALAASPVSPLLAETLREFIDCADWYRRCLEGVIDRTPVRGLAEARVGYDQALDRANAALASSQADTT